MKGGKSMKHRVGPTHHVQLDTPMENFPAMVETIGETPTGLQLLTPV
jgi:hypothetical protein